MKWHAVSADEAMRELGSRKAGLKNSEASQRLRKYGKNTIESGKKVSPVKLFLEQFTGLLILILIASSVILYFIGMFSGESRAVDAVLILMIVLANGIFGFFQNYKAEKGMEALKKMSAPRARVIRDGKEAEIGAEEIVPGDIVVLSEGSKVPADCRVLESFDIYSDESILTGESVPVSKGAKAVKAQAPMAEMSSMLFMNTNITRGRGLGLVVGTGLRTEVGKIAKELEMIERRPTVFQEELSSLGKKLAGLIGLVILLIASVHMFLQTMDLTEIFITSVALAVAAIPEGLPAVVTLSLAIGSKKMYNRKTLVRKLPVVESLGSVDVICTDKTGTLTENKLTVQKIFFSGREIDVTGVGHSSEGRFLEGRKNAAKDAIPLLKAGMLCNNARYSGDEYFGDPTEVALLVSARKAGLEKEELEKREPRTDEIAFSSERKRMVTVHRLGNGSRMCYMKGAPEVVLERCTSVLVNGRERKLTSKDRDLILRKNGELASQALRVLGFARKDLKGKKCKEEEGMVFLGLQAMIDPPRKEVKGAIDMCRKAGIRVIIETGDNPMTAKAVAEKLGLSGSVITGPELDKVPDDKLLELVESVSIFARVNPEHKVRVLGALQQKGHIVAMTGDGVNDAPALKKADVGISMGIRGTDVAKGTSDMILLDDNFSTIVEAVREGRTIFNNIRKFVNYLLTCNIAEVLTLFIVSIFGYIPVTAVQLLWINLVTDGPPALALGADPSEPGVMSRMPRPKGEGVLNRATTYKIALIGLEMTAILCALFFLGIRVYDLETVRTMIFTGFVLLEFVRIAAIRWEEKLNLASNKWLLLAVGVSFLLQLFILYSPVAGFFGVVPLALEHWIMLLFATGIGWFAGLLISHRIRESKI